MSDIHDLFHDNDTADPTTNGWAEEVRTRHRRNRVLTGVAAGVLAVGLAIPVGVTLVNRSGGTPVASPATQPPSVAPSDLEESAGPDPSDPVDPPMGASICQSGADEMAKRLAEASPQPVREGATTAWLCGDGVYQGPLDPLTEGVDDAVRAFLSQPEAPQDRACTMEYTMTYTVVFEYPDSTIIPVTGELHGCRTTSDGATQREGGQEFLDTVKGLWTKQRASSDFINDTMTACAEARQPIIPVDLTQLVAAQVCTRKGEAWDTAGLGADEELARQIVDSVEQDVTEVGDTWEFRTPERRIELVDRFGGIFTLTELADGRYTFMDGKGNDKAWKPSPELAKAIGLD